MFTERHYCKVLTNGKLHYDFEGESVTESMPKEFNREFVIAWLDTASEFVTEGLAQAKALATELGADVMSIGFISPYDVQIAAFKAFGFVKMVPDSADDSEFGTIYILPLS